MDDNWKKMGISSGPGFDEKGFLTSGRVRVGFDQKVRVSGSGSGIVHIMVLRLIL